VSEKFWICVGALSGAMSVTAGAMGTHYLKERLQWPEASLDTFEIAARYQMYHALALVLVGLVVGRHPSRLISAAGWAMLAGTVLFSGGLYAWLASGVKPFVAVVPIGGTIWIVAWVLLAVAAAKRS